MTNRKRPPLSDNLPEGDETARQVAQADELEQLRRGAAPEGAAPESASAENALPESPLESVAEAAPQADAAPKTVFEDSPSPVAALAHAYMHGPSDAPPRGNPLAAVAIALGIVAVGVGAVAGALAFVEQRRESLAVQGELQARIASLEGTLNGIVAGKLGDRVTALEKSVAGLEKPVSQAAGGAQAVGILAARHLRDALAGSGPFDRELALVRLSGVADAETAKAFDAIAPRAAEGIPTRLEVTARFAVLVPAVLNAELGAVGTAEGAAGSIGDTMWGWVTGMASTLRLPVSATGGAAEGESTTAALLTRAGIMLEAGDLSGAIERLSLLQGPLADVAAPWVADARLRVAADRASMLLGSRVDALLTAGKS